MQKRTSGRFEEEYKKLNKAQKEAVDTIDGPVMVVAGPGTGKTQILALRIGNILKKTDTKADSILCLTFTNSGVFSMRERLRKYLGVEGSKVYVSTFHKFGLEIIEENYSVLGFDAPPKILDEKESVTFFDSILNNNEWEHLRPRADATRHYRDLKLIISLLKREQISPEDFARSVKDEINQLKKSPESISTRGAGKGELKKEVVKKVESLSRSLEVASFYMLYEKTKKEENFLDYDDVLENLVRLIEESEEAATEIREKYLYVLIDEHQDSSGVQNDFLKKVWGEEELPNIFVVGDDRQLIYGFGGASMEYFEGFKDSFGKARLIPLVDNYRSTAPILEASHELLQSKITSEKLKSQSKESHPLMLVEVNFPRDEIILAGIEIKKKIDEGIPPEDIAVLVPKNKHVRSTLLTLTNMGVPVSGKSSVNFFESAPAIAFLRVLKIVADPLDSVSLGESLFDKFSNIPPLEAHKFLREQKMKEFSILSSSGKTLFENDFPVGAWMNKLISWINLSREESVYGLIQVIAKDFLLDTAKNHDELIGRVEVARTLLNLALLKIEKPVRPASRSGRNPELNIRQFVDFLNRLDAYNEHIPLSLFLSDEGVRVLTLHGSKGLEFDFVWIAHMNEKSLMSGHHSGFTLPENLAEKAQKKDVETAKRELYVAITRAKRFCTISYAHESYSGAGLELAKIISDLPEHIFQKKSAKETEKEILSNDPRDYVEKKVSKKGNILLPELKKLVAKEYTERNVSVSLLNNFFECPWKWYFRNLLQLPEPKTLSLEFGDRVHKAIDSILKMKNKPREEDLEEVVRGNKDVLKIISKWVEGRLPEIAKNRENEQSVSLHDERFPHLNIYGKIDLIEKLPARAGGDAKSVRVTDFKTGSAKSKNEIEKLDEEGRMSNLIRQLAMYSYLIKQSPKWKIGVSESRLEFLEAKNEKEVFFDRVITDKEIDLLVADIKDYDNLLKTGEWVKRPCNYNFYGKNTECEYCKMAEIYK
ncbi:MAG: ATP-dependent DNA helicase [bacterium]|nr:ATP-dependent DNA helicase [bacterium]